MVQAAASMVAMPFIPKENKDDKALSNGLKKIAEKLSSTDEYYSLMTKRQKQATDLAKKQLEVAQQIQKLNVLVQDPNLSAFEKRQLNFKLKLYQMYDKHIIKGNFFGKVLLGIFNIGKELVKLAGNSFFKILAFLLLMAIIDPKGKMLQSILNIIINLALQVFRVVARMLPGLIRTMINIVTKVLPGIIRNIVEHLFPALAQIFKKLGKGLGKDFPILGWIFKMIGKAFGKGGPLYWFFHDVLPKIFPILLGVFLFIGLIVKLMPFLKGLFSVFKGIYTVFKGIYTVGNFLVTKVFPMLFTAIKAIVMFLIANPIVAIAIAIIAALVLLWVFRDKIAKFFENLWEKFKKLSTGMKIVVAILALALFPLTLLALAIYGIVKLFQYLSKHGLKGTLKNIGGFFKSLGKKVWKGIKNIGSKIGNFFSDIGTSISNKVSSWYNSLKDTGKGAWETVKEVGKGAWETVKEVGGGIGNKVADIASWIFQAVKKIQWSKLISGLWDAFKDLLNYIVNFIKVIMHNKLSFFRKDFNFGTNIALEEAASRNKMDVDDINKLANNKDASLKGYSKEIRDLVEILRRKEDKDTEAKDVSKVVERERIAFVDIQRKL